jgi:hypothetical protein
MTRHNDTLIALGLMLVLLTVQALIWFPFIPNRVGDLAPDYSLWLPDMLSGFFWFVRNGIGPLPWFSPSQCAGIPFHADPQVSYLSLLQFLTFVMPPVQAAKVNFLVFAAAGYWGAWHLARRTFGLSILAALFAAALFQLNAFFGVRMIVGHLTYAPFMLLPALAACLLRPAGLPPATQAENTLRACLASLLIAISIQAGMVHIIPPIYLSLLILWLIAARWHGTQWPAAGRLAAATAIGLLLCAGKLAAALSLLSNFPRDNYPLPGIDGFFTTLYVAFRALFTPVSISLGQLVGHTHLLQDQHELEYDISVAPLLLGIAAAAVAWRQGWRPWHAPRSGPRIALWVALIAALLIPLLLNWYIAPWNEFLKSLPFFGNSSNLLRWFCAWILPAILAGALALDYAAPAIPGGRAALAGGGIALMVATIALADHSQYGALGLGFYDPTPLQDAWHKAKDSGTVPTVMGVTRFTGPDGALSMAPDRQNGVATGSSTLFCYEPLFGYKLERFPFGKIAIGPATLQKDGVLNMKNPACYVFPHANDCKPGDQFTVAQQADLVNFLNYQPYAFKKPWWAHMADWLNILAALGWPVALGWSVWGYRRRVR